MDQARGFRLGACGHGRTRAADWLHPFLYHLAPGRIRWPYWISRGFRIGNGKSCSFDSTVRAGETQGAGPGRAVIDVYRLDGVEPRRDVLTEVLARHLGVPAAGIVVDRRCAMCGGPHGKPFLDPRVHGPD